MLVGKGRKKKDSHMNNKEIDEKIWRL